MTDREHDILQWVESHYQEVQAALGHCHNEAKEVGEPGLVAHYERLMQSLREVTSK